MSTAIACPQCGAPLVPSFTGPAMVVCAYCGAYVGVVSGAPVAAGKGAPLAKTRTRFRLGEELRIEGVLHAFAGRTQYAYEDGLWDEWLLVAGGAPAARLSEDEGDLVLYDRLVDGPPASLAAARPGGLLRALGVEVVVAELGEARVAAAAGSLDRAARPGETFAYVDGSAGGGFASLRAWSDRSLVLHGRPLRAAEIEIVAPG